MSVLRPPARDGEPSAFAPILVANLLPLFGVLWLGWEPVTLVVIYGAELALSIPIAAGKALFAQRPPPSDREGIVTASESKLTEKRGRFRVHDALPPIYPRNVPFAASVVVAAVMYAVFFGIGVVAAFQPDASAVNLAVLSSVAALAVGQLAEARRQYFGNREYERVSPYAVVETPIRQLTVVAFALAFLGVVLGSTGALVLVVGAKLLVEWSSARAAREEADGARLADRFAGWLAGPSGATETPDPVRVPEAPEPSPDERFRPNRNAVLLEGALHSLWGLLFFVPFFGAIWLLVIVAVTAVADSVAVFWLGVVATVVLLLVALAVQVATHYLEHGTLEFQRRGDHLVATDRLLGEPQWAESVYRLRNVDFEPDRSVDRLLGTRTVTVTTGIRSTETERRLGPIDDPDRLIDVFELPLGRRDLEPVNRPLAVAALGLGAAAVLGIAAVLAYPESSMNARVNALFYAPFVLVIPVGLWKWACSTGG
ncbi:DUF6498-containing protein [Natronolimnohabitans innermongolicus]|uniref:Uncharacterized protein n=1 Tax=Natronolimnohabitans innermongolicus JCM 12255 TaxID=1227499 RepID=L9X1F2_9EURY|nr:DUF6498-containing protein [Natronolimnohabitans innermongolicus]ELY55535.1 hypothetical protein C493_11247 [Natronolimnohabitans innermongolicus JCM 12255]